MDDVAALVSAFASAVSAIVAVLTYLKSRHERTVAATTRPDESPAVPRRRQTRDAGSQERGIDIRSIIEFAKQYNRRVNVYENSLGSTMVALGLLAGFLTHDVFVGIGTLFGSGLLLGLTVWEAVVKGGASALRNIIKAQDLDQSQRACLADELKAIKWNSRTDRYLGLIIADLKE